MLKNFQILVAAFALLMTAASCGGETIVFTCMPVNNVIEFRVTAKSLIVDWGDGATEVYDNLDVSTVSHACTGEEKRTVRILRAEGLSFFHCTGQRLTALDVSGCPTLTMLDCSLNLLSSLDVSGNRALTKLSCGWNRLSSLNVSGNRALTGLACFDNLLSAAALDGIFALLPDLSGTDEGRIYIGSNPGSDDCVRSVAENKNWVVN
ncbi:MAG: hypothetical protein LBH72_02585 [Proteiniphilum sp.]|jgi:hypothetical protein|nr:hypothetical protein [Proteiniphilum sp.]